MQAREVDKAEEVLDVVFPSGDEPPEVVHPGEEPFHFPAPSVTSQFAHVLGFASTPTVGRDHLDAIFIGEFVVEWIRVVSFVADQPRWEFIKEASSKDLFHKLALGRRSAFDRYGERKTVISDSDDLGALAATRGANRKAPFLALANVASTKASFRFSWPCPCKWTASSFSASSSFPFRTHCWNLRWQVWKDGYLSGSSRHCAPVLRTHKTPLRTERVSCHGRPRLSARRSGRSTVSPRSIVHRSVPSVLPSAHSELPRASPE